jgi:sterol desaturase/sphingolipid hydroxylase (fatty acid hydroxylase superfamily)
VHDAVLYVIPVFALSMLVEWFIAFRRHRHAYTGWDTFASLSMGIGSVVVGFGYDVLLLKALSWVGQFALWQIPATTWWSWVIAIVAFDFAMYWSHRLHHEVRFGWAAHVNHHSSDHYNLSTALRQSWTEGLTSIPIYAPLALLGIDPHQIVVAFAINLAYQFFTHTEFIDRMGPLEWVLNTPSHHRVHHGTNLQYLDRNYAGMFIIWDRMFGTFEPEGERVVYGLTKNIHTFNPVTIAFHEWVDMARDVVRARSWRERWMKVWGRPGWSADGSSQTVPEARIAAGLSPH